MTSQIKLLIATLIVFILICSHPALSAPQKAGPAASARMAIQALYDKEQVAAASKDVDGVFGDLAPNFSAKDKWGHPINTAWARSGLESVYARSRSVSGKTSIIKFSLRGKTATIVTRSRDTYTMLNTQTGEMAKIVMIDVSKDLWVKSGPRWLIEHSQEISHKTTLNGRPVPEHPARNL